MGAVAVAGQRPSVTRPCAKRLVSGSNLLGCPPCMDTQSLTSTRPSTRFDQCGGCGPDPVPNEVLLKVIEAATMGPSGSNRQPWRFVVVKEPGTKEFIAIRYRKAWDRYLTPKGRAILANDPDSPHGKILKSARYLANHIHEAPALIFAYVKLYNDPARAGEPMYNAIFPAIQNLCLAARGYGLGTSITGLHRMFGDEIDALLRAPKQYFSAALIPIGYPQGRWERPARKPAAEVTHWERWDVRRALSASTS